MFNKLNAALDELLPTEKEAWSLLIAQAPELIATIMLGASAPAPRLDSSSAVGFRSGEIASGAGGFSDEARTGFQEEKLAAQKRLYQQSLQVVSEKKVSQNPGRKLQQFNSDPAPGAKKTIFHDGRMNFHELDQDYREDEAFMGQLKYLVESCDKTSGSLNIILGNEGYFATQIVLGEIIDKRLGERVAVEEKQNIGRNVLCKTTNAMFEHNFLHLMAIPLVQIEGEVQKYEAMLKVGREFLLKTTLSADKAFGVTDLDGNSPLHTMAALASENQFRAFCESFGDLISPAMWSKKNRHGHSPLDMLRDDRIQKEAINYISEKMEVEMNASEKSPSDLLHDPITLSRAYCGSSAVFPKGMGDSIEAYQQHIYKQRWSGEYDVVDPLNQNVILTLSNEAYQSIKDKIPDGETYSEKAFYSRSAKLRMAEEAMEKNLKVNPSVVVKSPEATKFKTTEQREL